MVELANKIAWPLVALFICIVFRRPLTSLIARIEFLSFGEHKVVKFGEASTDTPRDLGDERISIVAPDASGAQWTNSGNLFWLGHDLMWTMQVSLRGASLVTILRGLRQAQYHMEHINLHQSPGGIRLRNLLEGAGHTDESDWNAQKREKLAEQLNIVLDEVGKLAEFNQPDFQQDIKSWSTAAARLNSRSVV